MYVGLAEFGAKRAAGVYTLPCRKSADAASIGGRRCTIPFDDVMFYATLRRGFNVDALPSTYYVEAVCLWSHPEHGHMVIPMSLPDASALEVAAPAFAPEGRGVSGQWRLERKDATLVLTLVQELDADKFWAVVTQRGVNPPWMEACFAPYAGLTFRQLAALREDDDDAASDDA